MKNYSIKTYIPLFWAYILIGEARPMEARSVYTSSSCNKRECTVKVCRDGKCEVIKEKVPPGVSTSSSAYCIEDTCTSTICIDGKCTRRTHSPSNTSQAMSKKEKSAKQP